MSARTACANAGFRTVKMPTFRSNVLARQWKRGRYFSFGWRSGQWTVGAHRAFVMDGWSLVLLGLTLYIDNELWRVLGRKLKIRVKI